MRARVMFSCGNIYIPATSREISFSSERGLKRAFKNACENSIDTLRRFHGGNMLIKAEAYNEGKPVARMLITT